ncbi:hypothetical protein PROVRETT_07855 [Providencia rettgeri DSM 1131]|nr:hypothetical protein PROVRETT_07855 [Providencia rettgeri DSM 1131]
MFPHHGDELYCLSQSSRVTTHLFFGFKGDRVVSRVGEKLNSLYLNDECD